MTDWVSEHCGGYSCGYFVSYFSWRRTLSPFVCISIAQVVNLIYEAAHVAECLMMRWNWLMTIYFKHSYQFVFFPGVFGQKKKGENLESHVS